MIKEARLKGFLVQPCAVKACRQRKLYILYKGGVLRGGINTVGIKALIQHQPLEYMLSVQHQSFFIKSYIPEAEIGMHSILAEFQLHII